MDLITHNPESVENMDALNIVRLYTFSQDYRLPSYLTNQQPMDWLIKKDLPI